MSADWNFASTSARWARIGARKAQDAFVVQDAVVLGRAASSVSRTSSLGDRTSSSFRRVPSRQTVEEAVAPTCRPKMSAGMLCLLTAGPKSRFHQRPSTACTQRTPHEANGLSRAGSAGRVPDWPDWMTAGPPTSVGSPLGPDAASSPTSSPLAALKKGTSRKQSLRAPAASKQPESNINILLDFLHDLPLLSHLPREKLSQLVPFVSSGHEKFGAVLERENERTEHITIVWNGMVAVECKVLNATTCEEVPILSSCMRKPGQFKTQLELLVVEDQTEAKMLASRASLVTGKGGRGTVLGALASFFDTTSTETVRVESVGGAHVLRLPAAAVLNCCDDNSVLVLKQRVRQLGMWRQEQASNMSASMTAAAYHYAPRHNHTRISFPSTQEIQAINKKAQEDIWHPLGWRKKLQQQEERAAADLAMENRARQLEDSKRSKKSSTLRRPASALASTSGRRRDSRHDQKQVQVGAEKITDRNLFLATWLNPEQHRVHLGSGVRGDSASANGLHLELDIDAIKDLDGTYLANLQ
jgi:hypothetical protein